MKYWLLEVITRFTKKQFDAEKKYWRQFYFLFTSYCYDDLGHFDNYVGTIIKTYRAFFSYILKELGLNIGHFYRNFYAPTEEIEIIVVNVERINYLIFSEIFQSRLSGSLILVKDIFIFGCTVGLRVSDLRKLNETNLEIINGRYYIKIHSQKTQTFTRVKLPDYAIEIIKKYKSVKRKQLLPLMSNNQFNLKIKELMYLAGFTEPVQRLRQRRGIPQITNLKGGEGKVIRFCDLVSSHTMRRSAITNMLSLGMKEQVVRQISGHAANSKEFYRYVNFAQTFIDREVDMMHKKLSMKALDPM